MRPYVAIVIDSFREAIASRILWILLILATMLLAGLAPLRLESVIFPDITVRGMIDPDGLMRKILKEKEQPGTVSHRIWNRLSPSFRSSVSGGIVAWQKEDARRRHLALAQALNKILPMPDLYDNATWSKTQLTAAVKAALVDDPGVLEHYDLLQLNRRLLACAYPEHLPVPESFMCRATYFGARSDPFPAVKKDLVKNGLVGFVNFFVGLVGIFLSVLLTAGMVPRTFQPGSVDLLLSKPVSRSGVFLARYCGGCSFIALMSTYFIVGMFLIGGHLGVWTPRLLLCIPILVFNFAVFFSVSAFLGVYTRNVVISVLLTIFFWFICFSAGLTNTVMKKLLIPRTPSAIVTADNTLFAVNGQGIFVRWIPESREWRADFIRGYLNMRHTQVQPVYDRRNKRVVGFFESQLMVADAQSQWQGKPTVKVPPYLAMFAVHPDGTLYAITANEILRITFDPRTGTDRIDVVSDPLRLGFPVHVAMDPATGDVLALSRGCLRLFKRGEDGRYQQAATAETPIKRAILGFTASRLIVCDTDSKIHLYDRRLTPVTSFKTPMGELTRQIQSSPDGAIAALVFDHDMLYFLRDGSDCLEKAGVSGQGSVTAVAFADAATMLVASDITHIDTYQLPNLRKTQSVRPSMDFIERLFRFGVRPIYTVFPKPGELTNIGIYLVTGEKRVGPQKEIHINIWPPIYSCVIFTVIMLGISCFYISRKDY